MQGIKEKKGDIEIRPEKQRKQYFAFLFTFND